MRTAKDEERDLKPGSDAAARGQRRPEWELYQHLKAGHMCWVRGADRSGTAAVVERIGVQLRAEGLHVAALGPASLGRESSPEEWYAALLQCIARQLDPNGGLSGELASFWQEHARLGPLHRWMAALKRIVLPNPGIGSRVLGVALVIFLDGVDVVRRLPFSADELFAAIRECHNRRAQDPELQRLTFCLLEVAGPSERIRDAQTAPFNIGVRIDLAGSSAATDDEVKR
jgi:hypothetical protein